MLLQVSNSLSCAAAAAAAAAAVMMIVCVIQSPADSRNMISRLIR